MTAEFFYVTVQNHFPILLAPWSVVNKSPQGGISGSASRHFLPA